MYATEGSTSLDKFCRIIFRHKQAMTLFFVATMAVVAAVTFLMPRTYRSQAELLIRLGRENVAVDPTATVGQAAVVAVPLSRENELNSAIEVLKSRLVREKVVDAFGPDVILGNTPFSPPVPPDGRAGQRTVGPSNSSASVEERFRAIRALTKAFNAETIRKSNVLLITYDGPSPELSQAVVARLIDFYLERHMAVNRAPRAHQFLAEQTARLRAKLAATEEALRDLKNETGLSAPEGQRQILVNRIGRLQDELLQTTGATAAAEAEVRLLREKLAGLAPTQVTAQTKGVPTAGADLMRGQLYTLQIKELEMRTKLPEQHPDIQLLRRQIENAKEILAGAEVAHGQVTVGPNRVFEETQLALFKQEPALASLQVRLDTLRTQLAAEQVKLKVLNEDSLRIAKLQREFELQETAYRKYAENQEQTRIDDALETERISNISVAQPATYDPQPIRPWRLLNLALGLVFALSGSLALAFLLSRLDRSVNDLDDLEKALGMPALASIPTWARTPCPWPPRTDS